MKVRDYMSDKVVWSNLRDGLRQTFFRMHERGIRHMPVLDENERLVGMISDRDLRRPGWADEGENVAHYYLLDNTTKVGDAMTPDPKFVGPDDPIATAVALLVHHRFGALPVVQGDRVVGVISAVDLLKAFHDTITART